MSVAVGSSSVAKQDGDLVKSLRRETPEIEAHIWVLGIVCGIAFLAVNKVWELDGISDEENWGVVSNHIIVALLSVVLDGKAAGIAITVV